MVSLSRRLFLWSSCLELFLWSSCLGDCSCSQVVSETVLVVKLSQRLFLWSSCLGDYYCPNYVIWTCNLGIDLSVFLSCQCYRVCALPQDSSQGRRLEHLMEKPLCQDCDVMTRQNSHPLALFISILPYNFYIISSELKKS